MTRIVFIFYSLLEFISFLLDTSEEKGMDGDDEVFLGEYYVIEEYYVRI